MALWDGARRALPTSETFGGKGIPVATPPGAIAFTRVPQPADMNAALFVSPTTPCSETV
jgi:hypothetical protein